MNSRPPSPTKSNSGYYFSTPFEKFIREDQDWSGAFTLLDTLETYFDSHVDLIQRKLQKHSDRLKMKAEEAFKSRELNMKNMNFNRSGDLLARNFEKEYKEFKLKISSRMTNLSSSWQSAKVVRTREKVSFFFGVMSLLFSALMFGMAPEWVPLAYLVQGSYLLPLRAYTYKRKKWHYFMFDLCYYSTLLNFAYLFLFPSSTWLWIACYCLSHGSLASAVITWRNSLVFHDQDKVTSLFVHMYAPFTFTVVRHNYPNVEQRYPAVKAVPTLNPFKAILFSSLIYVTWQILYWKFVMVDRRAKIESGQRTTSFSFLLNDKRGAIGRVLSRVPEKWREASFMAGQLVYGVVTSLPAIFLLYDSALWSGIFLILMFAVSVWNGGGYYIEVFGRKFERELESLRKELADATARSSSSQASTPSANSPLINPLQLKEVDLPAGANVNEGASSPTVSSPSPSSRDGSEEDLVKLSMSQASQITIEPKKDR